MISAIFFIMSLTLSLSTLGGSFIPKIELEKGALLEWREETTLREPDKKGMGSFGNVYRGKWRGASVAIKEFHLKTMPPHLSSEFDFYQKASHPNIVRFYGICRDPGKFMMISELMPIDLAEYLHKEKGHVPNLRFIAQVGLDIARGLGYLHANGIAHKHLKSRNVFLDENLHAKISDFGLPNLKLESSSAAGVTEAPVRWRAPETFTREYARVKDGIDAQYADVYSFGVLLWEMYSGRKPYSDKSEPQVVRILTAGIRETMDPSMPLPLRELIAKCWHPVPNQRPTMAKVIEEINQKLVPAAEALPSTGWSLSLKQGERSHLLWKGESSDGLKNLKLYSPKPRELTFYKLVN